MASRTLGVNTSRQKAFDLGAPTLGLAVRKLEERWEAGLRDEETRLRLAFLAWYGAESPQVEHGLEPPRPLPADLLLGDEARAAGLSAEACFVTGRDRHVVKVTNLLS